MLNELLMTREKYCGSTDRRHVAKHRALGAARGAKNVGAAGRAESLLKELDLWALPEHHPATLSGGQKKRLAFAVGLMSRPDMIILDEPTSGMDGRNIRLVVKLIR